MVSDKFTVIDNLKFFSSSFKHCFNVFFSIWTLNRTGYKQAFFCIFRDGCSSLKILDSARVDNKSKKQAEILTYLDQTLNLSTNGY